MKKSHIVTALKSLNERLGALPSRPLILPHTLFYVTTPILQCLTTRTQSPCAVLDAHNTDMHAGKEKVK